MTTAIAGPRTGDKMKLYHNTGTYETEVWVEICEIGDLSVDGFKRAVALLERRCKQWGKNIASLMDPISFGFKLVHGLSMDIFHRMLTDHIYGYVREYLILNDDIAADGAEGLRLPSIFEEFPWDQPLKDVSSHQCKLSLSYMVDANSVEIDPAWVEATSSAVSASTDITTSTTAAPTTTTTTTTTTS